MKPLIWLVSLAGIGLAIAIGLAGPGTRFGWWDYSTGLSIIHDAALPTLVAAIGSAVGLFVALIGARGLAPLALLAAVLAGLAASAPIRMKQLVEANPIIHDVTTDFSDPPQIVVGALYKRVNPPEYNAEATVQRSDLPLAQTQQKAFPDIEPMHLAMSIEEAASQSRRVVQSMGMKILKDEAIEGGWRIEAADTSFWFGFVDDFVVRIREDGEGVRIDLRSKSRVGGSDLGENARRIRTFIKKMDRATA